MKEDDTEGKALANIFQLDMFFSGPDYMKLIEASQSGTTHAKKNAETLIEKIGMLDDTTMFFIEREEWDRCYSESSKLLELLNKHVSKDYKSE